MRPAPRFPRVCRYTACRKPFTVTPRERQLAVVYCSSPCGMHARGLDVYGRPITVAHLHPHDRRTA